MTTVIVNFPEATPGCQCPTCQEIREATRSDKARARNEEVYAWATGKFRPEQLIRP